MTKEPNTHEEYLRVRMFPGLDAVRCVSVLAVVWHHTRSDSFTLPIFRHGFLGVDMFFVLSGFLIVTLLLRERDDLGSISLRNFYIRRTLRIFPLYYAVVFLLAALTLLSAPNKAGPMNLSELPYFLTYTSNWVHVTGLLAITWSLAAEEQFYLVWPFLERFLRRWVWAIWIVAIVVNQGFNFSLFDRWLPSGFHHGDLEILQATFTPILLGVALAHTLHNKRSYRFIAPVLGSAIGLFSTVILLLAVLSVGGDISGWPRLCIHLLMVALLGSMIIRSESFWGFVSWAPVKRIGTVSYGVYLLHMFGRHLVQGTLNRFSLSPELLFVGTALVSWLVAEVSYRIFESRFLILKKKFVAHRLVG